MHNPIESKTEGVRTEVEKLRPADGKRGGEDGRKKKPDNRTKCLDPVF